MLTGEQAGLILGLTAVLFVTRISGLFIMGRLPHSPRLARLLDVLPGITMVAIVLPAVAASGTIGIIASLLVWGIVARTGSLGMAILLGVGLVAFLG